MGKKETEQTATRLSESYLVPAHASHSVLERKARLKLDFARHFFLLERRLIPILGLFFFLSFLDRSNLGMSSSEMSELSVSSKLAHVGRLQKDLRMSDHDYSMALTVTFMLIDLKYTQLVELPSNLLMYKIGPSIYIPLLVTIWGLVTCLQGLVTKSQAKNIFGGTATRDFLYPGESAISNIRVQKKRALMPMALLLCNISCFRFFLGLVEGKWTLSSYRALFINFLQKVCIISSGGSLDCFPLHKVVTTVARLSVFLTRSLIQVRAATSNRVVLGYDLSGWSSIRITDVCHHQPGWALGTSWLGLGFSGMFPCHVPHPNIEGFATSMFGLMGFFFLPSNIENVGFLTDAEKRYSFKLQVILVSRLKLSSFVPSGTTLNSFEKSSTFQTWEAIKSPHILILDVAHFAVASNIYSIAYFAPTGRQKFPLGQSRNVVVSDLVINSLVIHLQPLSCSQVCGFPLVIFIPVPPFAAAFVFVVLISYLSDRYQARGTMSSICALLSIVGFVIFYASGHETVRYGSLFLSIPGTYGVWPNMTAWLADNSAPSKRKAIALALGPMVGNMGGLFSVWVSDLYLGSQAEVPFTNRHQHSFSRQPAVVESAFMMQSGGVVIVCCFLNTMWLRHAQANKVTKRHQILEKYEIYEDNADPAPEKDGSQSSIISTQRILSAQAWDELGDKHPDFKYVY
ncbi:hypothetical protein VP01_1013g3 [Puccinia sorghi]|uniref:Uncharacterized protein n=1 Tax=Puccinia sorghi TaxID=27349 RepID=A0A0L6VUZ2_9BASI|nr:hypothetical protein VP01_1013g3 [Puccinia sorghi]